MIEGSGRLGRALGRLCDELADAVICTRTANGLQIVAIDGSLPITVEVSAAQLRVKFAGWSQAFPQGSGDAGDDAAEVDAALDLIGAALFGDVRVVVDSVAGQDRQWTLELRQGDGWTAVRACGSRSWNPFARRARHVLSNHCPRPPTYAAVAMPAPASAPWLGLAGFAAAEAGDAPVEVPIDGVLDLHSYPPKVIKELVLAYLEQCRARGIVRVRIIHGKGIGNLRRTVHALLDRHPHVVGYRLGSHGEGSWGATLVELGPPAPDR